MKPLQESPTTLFSYVVDHDTGFAPNPYHGYCTLAQCKFSKNGRRRNIIELAKKGDWIVGTGGRSKRSAGHGRIVYAMKVTNVLTLKEYFKDRRFVEKKRSKQNPSGDNLQECTNDNRRSVLISSRFWYFGMRAKRIPKGLIGSLEKRGPGFRRQFPPEFVRLFDRWIGKFRRGKSGEPWAQQPVETCTPRPIRRVVRRGCEPEGRCR